MKFAALSLLPVLAAAASVPDVESVVVSYPEDTPDWVLQKAKTAIDAAGGNITHEYKLIKGYAADMPRMMLANMVEAAQELLGTVAYPAKIEKDQIMSAFDSDDEDKDNEDVYSIYV